MASTYLTHTPNSTGNRRTWTMSVWMKISANTSSMNIMGCGGSSDQNHIQIETDKLTVRHYNGSANDIRLNSVRSFRDNNAWYHLVVRMDTTQSTASDRMRIYLNGEQLTNWDNATYPSQNYDWDFMDNGVTQYIGRAGHQNYQHWNGLLSHFHWCDGYSYAPTEFGETDATTGEWKIKTSPSVNYGTNGFLILKDGNTITDQSSNSNDWSLGAGTLTKTEDCPSNVFATWNPLQVFGSSNNENLTFTNGNTTASSTTSAWDSGRGTIGFATGKWYWEVKFYGSNAAFNYIGVCDETSITNAANSHFQNGVTMFYNAEGGEMRKDGTLTTSNYGTFSTSDVCGVAVDADNNTISIYKNGSAIVSNYALSTTRTGFLLPMASGLDNGSGLYTNFGNGYFGTTAVSSAGTNASGIGIFEYDVPTGYTALSTKGLNT